MIDIKLEEVGFTIQNLKKKSKIKRNVKIKKKSKFAKIQKIKKKVFNNF